MRDAGCRHLAQDLRHRPLREWDDADAQVEAWGVPPGHDQRGEPGAPVAVVAPQLAIAQRRQPGAQFGQLGGDRLAPRHQAEAKAALVVSVLHLAMMTVAVDWMPT